MAVSHWFFHWIIYSIDSFERLIHSGMKQVTVFMNGESWITDSLDSFRNAVHSWMKHRCVCFEMRSAHNFIWTYFPWWNRVKSCSTCLLICCIKPISHLQTPLIIIKSCHSPYRDLWAHRKLRERVSELSRHKSTCRSCSRGGGDFLVCRQNNNNRALHISFPLIFSNWWKKCCQS